MSGSALRPGAPAAHRPPGDAAGSRSFPATPVPGWGSRFPWLRAGTTRGAAGTDGAPSSAESAPAGTRPDVRGSGGGPGADESRFDPAVPPLRDMLALTPGSPWRSAVGSRQVHGSRTRTMKDAPAGPKAAGEGDGHVTRVPGVLLTVTVADCVPVFVADPVRRAVGLLHAGWRGTAAGVVESGVAALGEAFGSRPADMAVHLGPAVCGECYEVGPEVFRALGEPVPATRRPIDLRRVVGRRAAASGVREEGVSVSRECTLCGDGGYFSHRRGDAGRQRAFIGIVA